MKKLWLILPLATALFACSNPEMKQILNEVYIVPQPRELVIHEKVFRLDSSTSIKAETNLLPLAKQLQEYLSSQTAYSLPITKRAPGGNCIELKIDKYPELTQKGARFPEKWNEPEERQGFYTREDIREILAYAEKHHSPLYPGLKCRDTAWLCLPVTRSYHAQEARLRSIPSFKEGRMSTDELNVLFREREKN